MTNLNEATASTRPTTKLAEGLERWRDKVKQPSTDKPILTRQENTGESDEAYLQETVC